ncbi:hypothetical protein QWJ90_01300 [Microbacterium oryzae]|uniref:hypothetical protein n=1 Tax=Microbacterium oryzae TaxID=743009 RepID=UPI0025B1A643|nr:hypothetical protein [Microbacterium oryzae]MDN3309558.1 hypothetical protein [Microbacterium oryzae]
MIAVARIIRERRHTVARTLRETFGVGLSDLGDGLSWGEAKLLIEEASGDPSTALGAELADWAYPASMPDLLTLIAQIGNEKAARKVMPWVMQSPKRQDETRATTDEIAAAEAELDSGIVFAE